MAKKNEFEDLADEWKAKFAGADADQINREVRDVALYRVRLLELKGEDEHLAEVRETARQAGAVYSEGEKACKLKTKFLRNILKDRKQALPGD